MNEQHHRHHALPPQIADFPSQSIECKSLGGSVLCDDFIAHSQLWRRSGTLAFTARATMLPKLVLNCVRAQKIIPHMQFFAWNIIPMMGQSTSLSCACPNRVIWQPPTSPNAPILTPYHTSVRGGGFLIFGEIGFGSRWEGGEGVASKFTGNRWGDRGHNNQPSTGASKADGGL
jgi:hypothetical protein